MKFFIFSILLFLNSDILQAQPEPMPTVDPSLFHKGSYWIWSYAEYDANNQQWKAPYFYEKYTVTEVADSAIEIEMASDSKSSVETQAHHKFVFDINSCLAKGTSLQKLNSWSIVFYTKTFGSQWQLVSKKHQGLAFLEKFNCLSKGSPKMQKLPDLDNTLWEVFNYNTSGGSWFLYNHPDLTGVTMQKVFNNKVKYKAELFDYQLAH